MPVAPEYREVVPVPDGVSASIDGDYLVVRGPKGEVRRKFVHPRIKVNLVDGGVEVYCPLPKKKEYAICGTWRAHIRNMIEGVQKEWEYHLKVVYAHFPIKVRVDKEKNLFVIENFVGERHPRYAKILEGVDVSVKGDQVIVKGVDIEKVGQTAANIEKATEIKGYDTRVFQDGIYITKKAHREI